jgi:hypothetical protein
LRVRFVIALIGILVGLLALPTAARADPQQDLALAETRFQGRKYEEAAEILSKLLAVPIDPDDPASKQREVVYLQARPLYAACLVALGREAEADRVLLAQFRANPFYEMVPGQFPTPVVERFIKVRTENRTKIEAWKKALTDEQRQGAAKKAALERRRAERLATLEAMAAEEKVILSRTRWLAAVPFGVGQFQNGDTGLGIFFAAATTAAVGTSIGSFVRAQDIKDARCREPNEQGEQINCEGLTDEFNVARAVNWTSLGVTAALVIGGVIQAQVAFEEDQVQIKKRPIPPPVELLPDAVVSEQGAWFGLRGRF